MIGLILMITLPIALRNKFRNAGLKGALPYNLGIIFSILLGYILGALSFMYAIYLDDYTSSDNGYIFFFVAMGVVVVSYIVAGVISAMGGKKVEKNMPIFHPPGYIPPSGVVPPQNYGSPYGAPPAYPATSQPYPANQPYYGQPYAQNPYAYAPTPAATGGQPYPASHTPAAPQQPAPSKTPETEPWDIPDKEW
ncbi:hypothetical protein LJC61_03310 [Ruminococcaceae bacterium OttesenSCG-928-A16]|nr:hypothetical protein [Ruminococcaceae bacterium OttesenSCG-928-A16]